MVCARCVEDLGLLNLLVRLLDASQQCLSAVKGASVPKSVHSIARSYKLSFCGIGHFFLVISVLPFCSM